MAQNEQKSVDAGVQFERVVYEAVVAAMRNGMRASIIIENLRHQIVVVQSACELHKNVTGKEEMYP